MGIFIMDLYIITSVIGSIAVACGIGISTMARMRSMSKYKAYTAPEIVVELVRLVGEEMAREGITDLDDCAGLCFIKLNERFKVATQYLTEGELIYCRTRLRQVIMGEWEVYLTALAHRKITIQGFYQGKRLDMELAKLTNRKVARKELLKQLLSIKIN
jgi:hypothetical protein